MVAYPTAPERKAGKVSGTLVAPYESSPARRMKTLWVERGGDSDRRWRIRSGSAAFVVEDAVAVRSYRDVFEEYRMHPEAKAAGPDGRSCRSSTVGQLQPLLVEATGVVRIGKETNRLAEDLAVVDDPADRAIEYAEMACQGCGVPIEGRRQKRWCSEACRKRSRILTGVKLKL